MGGEERGARPERRRRGARRRAGPDRLAGPLPLSICRVDLEGATGRPHVRSPRGGRVPDGLAAVRLIHGHRCALAQPQAEPEPIARTFVQLVESQPAAEPEPVALSHRDPVPVAQPDRDADALAQPELSEVRITPAAGGRLRSPGPWSVPAPSGPG